MQISPLSRPYTPVSPEVETRRYRLGQIRDERRKRERERMLREAERRGDEIRAECQRLTGFIRNAWHVLEPAAPYVEGWAIEAMCEHLEAVHAVEILRLLMNVPPGMMKSLLTGVFFPAWEWGPKDMPHLRFLGTAHKETLAIRDNVKMRRLVESEWYRALWPDVRLVRDQNAKGRFENTKTGFRIASAFSAMTGERGDRVQLDDPHNVKGAESEAEREDTLFNFRETLPTRMNDHKRSAIIVIMQRLHEGDVSGEIIAQHPEYTKLILPMRFEPARRCTTSIGFTDPRTKEDELLFPERFGEEEVEQLEKDLAQYGTAGQLQQRPTPRQGGLFMVERIKIVKAPSARIVASVRYWDKAGTEGGGKYTAGVIVHRLADRSYLIGHAVRGQWSAGRREEMIKKYGTLDGPRVRQWVEQEPGSGGKESAESTIQNMAGLVVRADLVSGKGSKVARAEPLAVQIEGRNVAILEGEWNRDFIEELRLFPRGKYSDQCDSASGAFNKVALTGVDYDALARW